jgi:hypothetical protein
MTTMELKTTVLLRYVRTLRSTVRVMFVWHASCQNIVLVLAFVFNVAIVPGEKIYSYLDQACIK